MSNVRPASHRAKTLERRAALLAAATKLVAERGIEGVTHREVARRAGLAPSTTSYFFASIDELVRAATHEVFAELAKRLEDLSVQLREADFDVDELIEVVVPALLSAPENDVACQFQVFLRAAHHREWDEDVQELFAALEALVATVLERADMPASPALVRTLIALVDGFQLQRLARVEADTLRADLAEALRAVLAGIAASA